LAAIISYSTSPAGPEGLYEKSFEPEGRIVEKIVTCSI
jgi:hypothetical protein